MNAYIERADCRSTRIGALFIERPSFSHLEWVETRVLRTAEGTSLGSITSLWRPNNVIFAREAINRLTYDDNAINTVYQQYPSVNIQVTHLGSLPERRKGTRVAWLNRTITRKYVSNNIASKVGGKTGESDAASESDLYHISGRICKCLSQSNISRKSCCSQGVAGDRAVEARNRPVGLDWCA